MDRWLLIWKVWSGCRTGVLVEIPLLTAASPSNQLTSAKGTESLDRQTRVARLDWSSALDGGKTVRTGGERLEPENTARRNSHTHTKFSSKKAFRSLAGNITNTLRKENRQSSSAICGHILKINSINKIIGERYKSKTLESAHQS